MCRWRIERAEGVHGRVTGSRRVLDRCSKGAGTMTQHNRSLVTGLTFIATLGGLLFGYDIAVISGAVSAIDVNFIEPLNLSETASSSLSGWTVSVGFPGSDTV